MSEFNAFKQKYRQHLTVIRYASDTIKRYIYFLNRFFAWLEAQEITEISGVTKELIQDYQTHLYETVNSRGEPNSVFHHNNTLKAIKGFFSYLAENNYLVSDPSRRNLSMTLRHPATEFSVLSPRSQRPVWAC